MASSSSGDGPSTSGGRSEHPQYWDLVPAVVTRELGIVGERKFANKLSEIRRMGQHAPVAVFANPMSKRLSRLLVAASTKYLEMCKMLVKEYHCSSCATHADGTVIGGSQSGVEYLINNDPKNATKRGYYETTMYLCSKGASLKVAARHGHAKMVDLLLKHNAKDTALSAKRSLCRLYNCGLQSSLAKGSICQMALCSGIFWLMRRLNCDDPYPIMLCASDSSLMDILRHFFSDALDASPALFRFDGLPVVDRTMVDCSALMRTQLVDIIDEMEVTNKATICIDESEDGSEHKSLLSVQGGIGSIRAWCLKYGLRFDVSSIYGPNLMVYTTPPGGTFYLTIEHHGRSLTLLLAGRNLYFRGWRGGIYGAFEIQLKNKARYMLGEATLMAIPENYRFLSPDNEVGKTRMGPAALRYAFEILYKCQGERSKYVQQAIGIFAVHFSEAARIQCVYKAERRSFLTYDQATLDIEEENSFCISSSKRKHSFWVSNYGHYCTVSLADTKHRLAGTVSPGIQNRRGGNVRSSVEVFREIRIVLRDACADAANEKDKPPMVEDPDDHHNRMRFSKDVKAGIKRRLKQESRGQKKKPRLEEFSVGGGDGGSALFAYLLEDWYLEADEEQEKDIKEEAYEEQEKDIKEEADEEQAGDIKEEADEEQQEEIKEDAGEGQEEEQAGDIKEEADEERQEEIKEDAGEGQEEEQAGESYGKFLSHFPAVRKFLEKKEQEEIKEEADDEEAGAFYGEFLIHFPAIRKFVEKKQNQVRPMLRIPSSMDVSSLHSSATAKMTSTRTRLFPQRSPLPQRPSRALIQPSLVRAARLASRVFRFVL